MCLVIQRDLVKAALYLEIYCARKIAKCNAAFSLQLCLRLHIVKKSFSLLSNQLSNKY